MKTETLLPRRRLLRAAFYAASAAAVTPLLSACRGGGSAAELPRLDSLSCSTFPGQGQLDLPLGRLANIGPLGSPAINTLIAVPEGFSVRPVATSGLPVLTPGGTLPLSLYAWHVFPDGGATFARDDGGWIYTSNSEVPGLPLGGCGAIGFNAQGEVDSAYAILRNTTQNCAGGKTPWDTWVSCEEDSAGQCWECDPYQPGQGVVKPALGRFAHEAMCVDPVHNVIYLTEDASSGRFYRWVANRSDVDFSGRLAMESGSLEVMNLRGYEDGCYPESDDLVRQLLEVSWRPVIDPAEVQSAVRSSLQSRGLSAPGTRFNGGEGLWYHQLPEPAVPGTRIPQGGIADTRGVVFWTTKGDNRVWALDVENQLVETIFDNLQIDPDFSDVDNLTVSPWGDVLVAEDPPSALSSRIIVVIPNKPAKVLLEVFHPGSEICGPAFSPDGSRLYFSSQRRNGIGETYELLLPPALLNPA